MKENQGEKKDRAAMVTQALYEAYPNAKCSLHYNTPHELLIATILSAQCTDHRVNQVTQSLFKKYLTLKDFVLNSRHFSFLDHQFHQQCDLLNLEK